MDAETTQELLDGFERWLRAQDYAASTVAQTRTDAARILTDCWEGRQPPARLFQTGRRLQTFLEELQLADLPGPAFARFVSEEGRAAWGDYRRRDRVNPARSVDDDNWVELYRAVREREGIEARVIEAMMVTGLRIGDVLRIERKALADGLARHVLVLVQKGGRERTFHLRGGSVFTDAFGRLFTALPADVTSVQDALGTNYMAAYQRVRRKLIAIADAMELPGRAHTHRLRRTVAMQALRQTKDIHAVQQLLGHASLASTQHYVDEERPDDVADLGEALAQKHLKGPDR